ncbi:Similar to hypothetical protein [Tuber melanosporum Mel28]; acc. no. XP_002842096 [Pyronema omphalodes CBS 100304]|uniref:Mmc1 C-terminal domain-containing protein n=1 Tax=Pyronema omphalodes (strain CBS 100304) TaxID=1076935 RepID=U4KV23_PYROM|nr:Similar to hypothetical protein [Tuber melanosporum Mel28]; acc. no. XP_002842096 [Pyronema omphalodes CBS 100304]
MFPPLFLRRTLAALSAVEHGIPESRIELALRGIEQKDAPVRIAVVGEEILPVLLGGDEGWTAEIKDWVHQYSKPGRGVLLRWGATHKATTPTGSPLTILIAPIELLKTNNMELVVMSRISRDPLVPVFNASEIKGARVIEYPVHKTLVYGGSGAEGVARVMETVTPTEDKPEQILRLVSLPGEPVKKECFHIIDVEAGKGIEAVKSWLVAGTTTEGSIKPVVKTLLHDILSAANKEISVSTPAAGNTGATRIEGGDSPDSLAAAISTWSHTAHLELKSSVAESQEWRKLDWWKLLWRVDDVGHISRHAVTTSFLRHSEADSTFLAGRLYGAGYRDRSSLEPELELERPYYIAEQRNHIVTALIPGLQAAAQKYLLSSLSTSGLSAVFSTLLYLSDIPLYSAMTVAAVGTVGSARWLQSRWMKERRGFQENMREKGREAIVESERWAWNRLKEGIATETEEVDAEREKRLRLREELEEGIKKL